MFSLIKEEKGQAVIEFALSLFFLFTLTAGIVDFGNILNQYSNVVEAAHQGARFASGINLLKDNGYLNDGACQADNPTARATDSSGLDERQQREHKKIQERVDQILSIDDTSLEPTSLCLKTSLEQVVSNGVTTADKNVVVTVEVAYQSILYGRFPIRAQARAPFLQS